MARPIDEARAFITHRVLDPVINSPSASEKVKNVTKSSRAWLQHFDRVGDLISYMSRFDPVDDAATYRELRVAGFETFEDISGEFVQRFSAYKNDRTRLSDFVVGDRYSSQQILIAAGRYDTRSGGILPIGSVPDHQAVLIKATLAGGKYPNKWIETGQRLKYYLKSRKEVFDESYYENRAIIESPTVPIYGFWPAPNQWSIFYERVRTV